MAFLDSYRVLDFTDERGLLAGRMLADLGADVVQVEPPQGSSARGVGPFGQDGRSLYWDVYASNKRSVVCDLATDEGRDAARQLAGTADFLFESSRPGTMAGWGLGYEDLRAGNPRLIYVSITPFGSDGPKAHYADSEIVVWAAGGPLHRHRDGDRPPLRISVPQAYFHASADAAVGALIAHIARRRTGLGQHVDVSAQQSVTQATLATVLAASVGDPVAADPIPAREVSGEQPKKVDRSATGSATGSLFSKWKAADGYVECHLAMGPPAGRFTNNLFRWISAEGGCDAELAGVDWILLADDIERGDRKFAIVERARTVVGAFFASRTKTQLIQATIDHRLLIAPVLTMKDIAESPQLEARAFWADVESPAGMTRMPGPFAHVTSDAFVARRPAPAIGAHTDEVLRGWQTSAQVAS